MSGAFNEIILLCHRLTTIFERSTSELIVDFLEQTIVKEFLLTPGYFVEDNYTFAISNGQYLSCTFVGNIRIRQQRVNSAPCSPTLKTFVQLGLVNAKQCLPHWSASSEATKYTHASGNYSYPTIYDYVSASQSAREPISGRFGSYDGGGFMADIDTSNASGVISEIIQKRWIDQQTRIVSVDFILYSPNADLFARCTILFEVAPGNVAFPRLTVQAFFPNRYPMVTIQDYFRILYEVIVYLMVAYYIWEEIQELRSIGFRAYFGNFWNYLDIINLLMLLAAGYYKIESAVVFKNTFSTSSAKNGTDVGPVQIATIANGLIKTDQVNGINGLFLWTKVFKYVAITRKLRRLAFTVYVTLIDVFYWAVLFFIVAMAFAVSGFIFFHQIEIFGTVGDSLITVVRTMYGDSQYQTLAAVTSSGYLYLFCWLFVSRTVLLNIVIGIFYHSYVTVRAQDQLEPAVTDLEKILAELRRRADADKGMQGRILRFVLGPPKALNIVVGRRRKKSRSAAAEAADSESVTAKQSMKGRGGTPNAATAKAEAAKSRLGWLTGTAPWKPWVAPPFPLRPLPGPPTAPVSVGTVGSGRAAAAPQPLQAGRSDIFELPVAVVSTKGRR